MGMQILQQNSAPFVVQPFVRTGKPDRTVQMLCNVQSHQHKLVHRKAVNTKKPTDEFVIEFSLPAFKTISKTGNESLKSFARKIKMSGRYAFCKVPLPMNAAMHQCIYRMTHYAGNESVKCMYLYGQIVELLVQLQLSYEEFTNEKPVYIKNEYDKERILYARDYLLTHMDAPPGLSKLAAIVGVNEFKLKCGFKEMFGQPPFVYLADVRMEMARTALQKKEKTITQIAFELGYASLQHFSMAYKKKFGMSPSKEN
jgi:AraC family transcriptional activator of pyochelin receptor